MVTLLFFAGFLLTFDAIPGWWIWYRCVCVALLYCCTPPHALRYHMHYVITCITPPPANVFWYCSGTGNHQPMCLLCLLYSTTSQCVSSVSLLYSTTSHHVFPPCPHSYIDPLRYAWGALMVNQFNSCCPGTFLGGQTVLQYVVLTMTI